MTKTLTITLPDALEQALAQTAAQTNQSPEALILQLLTQNFINQKASSEESSLDLPNDPLMQLAGCITSDIVDVADHHDDYIGQAIYDEMHQDD